MNRNMKLILEYIENLRDLDNWPPCDKKDKFIEIRQHFLESEKRWQKMDESLPTPFKKRERYLDPLGHPISLFEWSTVLEELLERHIGDEEIEGVRISTVWMGNNMGWFPWQAHIFETMIFDGEKYKELDGYMERYSTIGEAEEGHKRAVELVKKTLGKLQ